MSVTTKELLEDQSTRRLKLTRQVLKAGHLEAINSYMEPLLMQTFIKCNKFKLCNSKTTITAQK